MKKVEQEFLPKVIQQIESAVEEAIQGKVFSGAVIGLLHHTPSGYKQTALSFGHDAYLQEDSHSQPVDTDMVFDVASVTKSIPLALTTLAMYQHGLFQLDTPVTEYLPEFKTPFAEKVQVRHLLTHTLDYRFSLAGYKDHHHSDIVEKLMTHQFEKEPGTDFLYCNSSSLVLGLFLEAVAGEPLDMLARKYILGPMQLERTGFFPLDTLDPSEIMPTEICSWRGRIMRGELHDESAYAMRSHGVVGSAGLFSTAPELLQVLQMLLQDGRYGDKAILQPGVLSLISSNATPHLSTQAALGFELNQTRFMGSQGMKHRFGKTGFTGSSICADPDLQRGLVILSNFTWPKREANADRINAFRSKLADIVFEK